MPVLGSLSSTSLPGLTSGPVPSGDTAGVTDTAAIQALINAATSGDGGIVQLRAGLYWTTGLVMKPFVTLRGAGWRTVIKAVAGTSGAVIGSDPGGVFAAEVSDLAVHGNRASTTSDGIDLHHAVPTQPNAANIGDACNRVRNCSVSYSGRDGIVLGSKTSTTHGSGEGEQMAEGCYVFGSGRYGMLISSFDCNVWNCTVGASVQHGIVITGNQVRLYNTKAWYSGWDTITHTGPGGLTSFDGFYIGQHPAGATSAIQLSGCQSQDNGRYGLNIDGVSGVKVSGHVMGGDYQAGVCIGNGASLVVEATLVPSDRFSTLAVAMFNGNASGHQLSFHSAVTTTALFQYMNGGSAKGCDVKYAASAQGYIDNGSTSGTVVPSPTYYHTNKYTFTGAATIGAATKAVPGQNVEFLIVAGSNTVTWDASYTDPTGTALPTTGTFTIRFRNIAQNTDVPTWIRL